MSTYIIDLISHLTLRKIGLTRIKTLFPPMPYGKERTTPKLIGKYFENIFLQRHILHFTLRVECKELFGKTNQNS